MPFSFFLSMCLSQSVDTIINKENDGQDLTCDVYTEDPQFEYSSSVTASVKCEYDYLLNRDLTKLIHQVARK